MGVYHITYTRGLSEVCLYLDGGCNFSCHGCITDYHLEDCHIEEPKRTKNKILNIEEVIAYLKPLSFEKAIFLGKEPTEDRYFLPLAKILKEKFSTHNIFLANGWEYIEDKALDEVCVSIKAVTPEIFRGFTGKDTPGRVLENFKRYKGNPDIVLRAESIFIPDFIDIDEIEKIAQFIVSIDSNIPYRIDGYIPTDTYFGMKDRFRRPTEEEMKAAKMIAEKYLKSVSILHYGVNVKYKVERIY